MTNLSLYHEKSSLAAPSEINMALDSTEAYASYALVLALLSMLLLTCICAASSKDTVMRWMQAQRLPNVELRRDSVLADVCKKELMLGVHHITALANNMAVNMANNENNVNNHLRRNKSHEQSQSVKQGNEGPIGQGEYKESNEESNENAKETGRECEDTNDDDLCHRTHKREIVTQSEFEKHDYNEQHITDDKEAVMKTRHHINTKSVHWSDDSETPRSPRLNPLLPPLLTSASTPLAILPVSQPPFQPIRNPRVINVGSRHLPPMPMLSEEPSSSKSTSDNSRTSSATSFSYHFRSNGNDDELDEEEHRRRQRRQFHHNVC